MPANSQQLKLIELLLFEEQFVGAMGLIRSQIANLVDEMRNDI